MTLFRVPKLPADTPPGLGAVLANAFKQLYADLQALFQVPGDITIRTSSYRPVAGETVRVSPPATGMGFILPAPAADNRGARITAILESPEGALRVFVSPGSSPTGNGAGLPTIDGAEMVSFSTAGAVPFVSNGVDKWSVARGPAGAAGATGATGATGPTGPAGAAAGITALRFYDDFEAIAADVTVSGAGGTRGGTLQTAAGNWGVSGNGTVSFTRGESGAPGIVTLLTSSTTGVRVHLASAVTDGFLFGSDFGECTCRFRLVGTSTVEFNFGLIEWGTFGNYLLGHFNDAESADLQVWARNSFTDTTYVSSTPPGALTWHTIRLVQTSPGSVDVYLDGANIHTISSNVPTALLNFYLELYSHAAGTPVSADVDVTELLSKPLAR